MGGYASHMVHAATLIHPTLFTTTYELCVTSSPSIFFFFFFFFFFQPLSAMQSLHASIFWHVDGGTYNDKTKLIGINFDLSIDNALKQVTTK
ncbi:hypothetical protein ACN38_g2618 [Penicillium nordicum]|uniref:Uncharacterized protein n=1 Tax=Penicillium nordicum TaxID=229535 RepID=A0A0M8PDH8_9EURO|nr:hypothetical protein ACN38_g2618 [Penicillium nordicum]